MPIDRVLLWLPEILMIVTGLAVFMVDFIRPSRKWLIRLVALGGLAAAGLSVLAALGPSPLYRGLLEIDYLTNFARAYLVVTGALVILMSWDMFDRDEFQAEYYGLMVFALLGGMVVAAAKDFIVLYLGIELMALPIYALVAFIKKDVKAIEAGLKYFLLGLFASVVMLYGMAFIYGLTGTTSYGVSLLASKSIVPGLPAQLPLLAFFLLLAGVGFKLIAFPFHFWAPDTYEGASSPVVGFVSVAPKVALFVALARLLGPDFALDHAAASGLLALMAVASMSFGNLMALAQNNVKRMMAYSGVAHTGYLLIVFAIGGQYAINSLLFYLIVYGLGNLGVFAVVTAVSGREAASFEEYTGLGRRSPYTGFMMVVFLMSLAGIPPLAGFFGKLYVFGSAVGQGFAYLALIALLNSAVALGYYLRLVQQMYVLPWEEARAVTIPAPIAVGATVAFLATLSVGVLSYPAWY